MEPEGYHGAHFEIMKIKRESADEISIRRCHVVRTITSGDSTFLGSKPFRPKSDPVFRRIDPEKHIAVNLLLYKVTSRLKEDGTSKEVVARYGGNTRFTTWVNWVNFCKGGDEREECKKKLADFLEVIHVTEDARPSIIEKISKGIDATANNVLPLYLVISCTFTLEDDHHDVDATNLENIKTEMLAVDSCCAICQGDYCPNNIGHVNTVVRWRCGHYYHKHCSDPYFEESYLCPLCSTSAYDSDF